MEAYAGRIRVQELLVDNAMPSMLQPFRHFAGMREHGSTELFSPLPTRGLDLERTLHEASCFLLLPALVVREKRLELIVRVAQR
jgi:hypothetical protein